MLRRIFMLMLLTGVLSVLLVGPAAAAPVPVGRYQDRFTVYEERRPGDPNLYRYYVEDGAIKGSGGLQFLAREDGMESVAFSGSFLLFVAAAFAVYRRNSLNQLLAKNHETVTA